MTGSDSYFYTQDQGRSSLGRWGLGFWFIFLGWFAAQNIFGGLIPTSIAGIRPDLIDRLAVVGPDYDTDSAREAAEQLQVIFSLLLISAPLLWAVSRLTQGTVRRLFTIVAALAMISSFVTFLILLPRLSSGDYSALMGEMIGASPIAYALMLLAFPATAFAAFMVQKINHKRPVSRLFTPSHRPVRYMRDFQALVITLSVSGAAAFILHVSDLSPLRATFDPTRFFAFAIVSLLLIPLQSATEEIIFRGYLNQAGMRFIPNKYIVFVITSAAFAALHLSNPEAVAGSDAGVGPLIMIMTGYFAFGFILCLITDFENGLEAAIGIHAGNNLFAALFVNYEGSVLPVPSVFLAQSDYRIDTLVTIIVFSLIALFLYPSRRPG